MSPSRTSLPRAARWLFRSVGPASVVAVGWLLSQGRFRGVAEQGTLEPLIDEALRKPAPR